MRKEDLRMDRMIEIADRMNWPLDHIVHHMAYCDDRTFRAYSDNPSLLPRYIQSSDNP